MSNYTRVIPVGGCGEIGLNLTAIETNGVWFFVDSGLMFPEDRVLGIDFVAPDLSWFHKNGIVPVAWLITHGHEDHIGALPFLYREFPAPIFAPALAAEYIREKFDEENFRDYGINVVEPYRAVEFENFIVTPVAMSHSIPDACGYLVDTLDGKIFLTGDFRLSDALEGLAEKKRFFELLGNGPIDILLADSTNAMVSGRDLSESSVSEEILKVMEETQGKVFVVTFASSIWRFQSVLQAARKCGRGVYFLGRSMEKNAAIANKLGMLKGYEGTIVGEEDLHRMSDDQLCIMASGSQGEVFSGASRLAFDQVKNITVTEHDTLVLSARTIPGNERAVGALLNHFARKRVRIVTPRERDVHVSGHGFSGDILELIEHVKPKYYMPIHGQYRHLLANANLAIQAGMEDENVFIAENGSVVEIRKGTCRVSKEKIETGILNVSQMRVVDKEVMRQRELLAFGGVVSVSFFLLRDGNLAAPPRAILRGVLASESALEEDLPRIYEKALANLAKKKQAEVSLEDLLRTQVRKWIEQATRGVRAMVVVAIHKIP